MTAKITTLTRYPEKGEPGIASPELTLIAGRGIEGDCHRDSPRPVSLLLAEARRWMESQPEKGLCFGRFRENILIEGLSPEALIANCTLTVGDAALHILADSKYCFHECRYFSEETPCPLSIGARFATVLQDGVIRIGDEIRLVE